MPLGMEVGLGPGNIVLDGDPANPKKWSQQPPLCAPCLLVAKQSPISATAEFLLPAALRAAQAAGIYSEADFEVFHPTGTTRCTDGGKIWHG